MGARTSWPGALPVSFPKTGPCERHREAVAGPDGKLPVQSYGIAPQYGGPAAGVQCVVRISGFLSGRAQPVAEARAGGTVETSGPGQHLLARRDDRSLPPLFLCPPTSFLVAGLLIFGLAWLKLPAGENS